MLIFRGVTICQFSSPINPLDFTNWLIYICMVFFQRICHLVSGGNNSWNSKRKNHNRQLIDIGSLLGWLMEVLCSSKSCLRKNPSTWDPSNQQSSCLKQWSFRSYVLPGNFVSAKIPQMGRATCPSKITSGLGLLSVA